MTQELAKKAALHQFRNDLKGMSLKRMRSELQDVTRQIEEHEPWQEALTFAIEKKTAPLTLNTPDSTGYLPVMDLVGTRIYHLGNEKTYVIEGFAWMGETDEWGYVHREEGVPGSAPCCRPMRHLTGDREDGRPRYTRVTEGLHAG